MAFFIKGVLLKYLILMGLVLANVSLAEEKKFSNESELSAVTAGGNSELETYNAKTTNKLKVGSSSVIGFGGHWSNCRFGRT